MDKTASENLQNKYCLLMKIFFFSSVPYCFFIVSYLQGPKRPHLSERLENIVIYMQECSVQFVKMNKFYSDAHFITPYLRTVLFYLQCPGIFF